MAVDFNAEPTTAADEKALRLERFRQQRREKEAARERAASESAPTVADDAVAGSPEATPADALGVIGGAAVGVRVEPDGADLVSAAAEQASTAAVAAGRRPRSHRRDEIASAAKAMEDEEMRRFLTGDRDVVAALAHTSAGFTPTSKDRQR